MYLPYPQLHAGNKCHVPLRVHSQCEGAGECVEREGVTMLPSLPTERLVEWRVGIAEGHSQPSASTAPTHDMVCMYCMCTCTTFCTISSPVTQTLHTYVCIGKLQTAILLLHSLTGCILPLPLLPLT